MVFQKLSIQAYNQFIQNNAKLIVKISLVISTLICLGAITLEFSTNYREFFSKENPQLQTLEKFQATYSKTDILSFVIHNPKGDLFTNEELNSIHELTEASWQLPFSTRVDSIINFQHTESTEDELTVRDLVDMEEHPFAPEQLLKIKNIATREPNITNRLISDDGDTTQIAVTMQFGEKDRKEVTHAAKEARKLFKEFSENNPHLQTALSGTVMLNNAFVESIIKDMFTLFPIMMVVITIIMYALLRSVTATGITLAVLVLSSTAAMGFAGWVGYPLTPPSASAVIVVLTLAVADSVHILSTMFRNMRNGLDKTEAITESLRINFNPVFVTSATTALGFLSLNFSDAPPFRHLGNMSAFGVMVAFVLSVTLLPALVYTLNVKAPKESSFKNKGIDKLASFVIHKHKLLFIGLLAFVTALGSQAPNIQLNDQFVKYFDHSIQFRRDTEFMEKHLTGIYQAEFSLPSKGEGGVNDPEYLKHVEKFSSWLKQQDVVLHVLDQTETYKRLNKNMHGDDASYYHLPDNRELAAQYMLLYEMSLPFGLDMNDRVNIDKSATRVSVTLRDLSTTELQNFEQRATKWIQNNLPTYMHTEATGPAVIFAYVSQRNIDAMMKGNMVALISICIIIGLVLRSVKMGFISMVPNIVPALMAFGAWALIDGNVNMAVATIVAISLGIVVDDTVHFMSKYQRAKKEKNLNEKEAVRYAFHTVGQALIITTIILMAGFLVLAFSSFQANHILGILTTIAIGFALLVDFLLLPPLLLLFDKTKTQGKK